MPKHKYDDDPTAKLLRAEIIKALVEEITEGAARHRTVRDEVDVDAAPAYMHELGINPDLVLDLGQVLSHRAMGLTNGALEQTDDPEVASRLIGAGFAWAATQGFLAGVIHARDLAGDRE